MPKKVDYKTWGSLILATLGIAFGLFMWLSDKSDVRTNTNTKQQIEKAITDTLQNRELLQLHGSLYAVNLRQDETESKLNECSTVKEEIKQFKNIMVVFINRFDKTLLPLLQERQSLINSQVDSMNIRNYSYNDSLSVYKFIDNSVSKYPEKKEYDECVDSNNVFESIYNLVFQNSFVSPFFKRQSINN